MSAISPETLAAVGRKTAKARISVYRIEGENVTQAQMAERLGISLRMVSHRLCAARKVPGPITWERLGLK